MAFLQFDYIRARAGCLQTIPMNVYNCGYAICLVHDTSVDRSDRGFTATDGFVDDSPGRFSLLLPWANAMANPGRGKVDSWYLACFIQLQLQDSMWFTCHLWNLGNAKPFGSPSSCLQTLDAAASIEVAFGNSATAGLDPRVTCWSHMAGRALASDDWTRFPG